MDAVKTLEEIQKINEELSGIYERQNLRLIKMNKMLTSYEKFVNSLDDRLEYSRSSFTREEIHAKINELCDDLVKINQGRPTSWEQ